MSSASPVPPRIEHRQERRRIRLLGLTPRAALASIAGAAVGVAALGALVAFLVDREAFGSFGEALWWSVVTVGTVGYGDVVPTNDAGRIVASALIVFTMAFFPILTGAVTATLIDESQRATSEAEELQDEGRQAELLAALRSIDERLTRLEDRAR